MQNLIPTNAIENTARAKFFGELVLTTAQLAEFYGTSTDNIKKNFNANKERFIDGKHYYRLEGENLRRFQSDIAESSKRQNADLNLVTESYAVQEDNLHVTESYPQISSKARTLYVWTKRGAARHAKILNTDRAWDVFELLEDTYFKLIDGKNAPCRIQPVADLLLLPPLSPNIDSPHRRLSSLPSRILLISSISINPTTISIRLLDYEELFSFSSSKIFSIV